MDEQLNTRWAVQLEKLVRENHPTHRTICRPLALSYYWTACESEYATDVMFAHPQRLARFIPAWCITGLRVSLVRTCCGFWATNPRPRRGQIRGGTQSSLKRRPEGLRLKHFVNGNSLKLYDKQGSVLRVETTINHPEEFKIWRAGKTTPNKSRAGASYGAAWPICRGAPESAGRPMNGI